MQYILQTTCFWFFAILGFAGLVHRIARAIFAKVQEKKRYYVLVTVRNEEDAVEGMLRGIVWSYLSREGGGMLPEIIVVDLDSTDGTYEVLNRLAEEYSFLHPLTRQEYAKYIHSLIER